MQTADIRQGRGVPGGSDTGQVCPSVTAVALQLPPQFLDVFSVFCRNNSVAGRVRAYLGSVKACEQRLQDSSEHQLHQSLPGL